MFSCYENDNLLNLLNKGPLEDEREKFNKFLSKVRKQLFDKPLFENCQICKKHSKFCSSHTIPQFILKNIANKGHLYNQQILNDTPLTKTTNGIKNTQTFESICCECDSKVFQNYENSENYSTAPTEQMLNEIALKCHLFSQYRLTHDIKMHEYANKEFCNRYCIKEHRGPYSNLINCHKLDKKYHAKQIEEILKAIQSGTSLYKIGYYAKLNYIVPIVFQDCFSLYFDLRGRKINNPFSDKIDGLDYLFFCIFPFEKESIVFIFYKTNCHKYNNFFQDLKSLPLDEQLSIINFLIFIYSENLFISKDISNSVLNDIKLKSISQLQPVSCTTRTESSHDEKRKLENYKKAYNIANHKNCANLLDKKYALP